MTQIVEVLQGNQTTEVEFPDDMSPQAIEEVLRREFPPVSAVEAEVIDDPSARPSTIGEEWTRGVERLKIDYPTFAKSFSNPEEAALEAMAKGEEVAARLGRPASMDDVMKAYEEEGFIGAGGEVLQAIPRVVASQLPNTGANLAGAFAGSRAVAGLAGLLGAVPYPAARIAGGILGGAATILPQLFSQNIQRQAEVDIAEERPVEIDAKKATLAAVAQTAAEGVGTYMTLGRSILSRIIGIAPKPRGVRSSSFLVNLAQDSLRGVVRGAGYEIPTEISQQIIERAQAGLDVMSDEAYAEYGEAAYMAGIAGGTIGGVAGAVTPVFSQPAIEDLPGDLPTTADLSEITQETVAPDLPATEPTPDITGQDAVSRLKNLGEAYDEDARRTQVQDKINLIAPNLRGTLKGRGLDDIGINLSYSLENLGGMARPEEIDAIYDPDVKTIFLGADRIQGFGDMDASQLQQEFGGLVDHEMVHAVKRMNLWNAAEWKVLENAARKNFNSDGVSYLQTAQNRYSTDTTEIQSEEAIAELIRDTLAGRTGLAGQPLSLMRRLLEFFRKMGNSLTGTGYASFGQVVNDIDSGVLGARPRGGRQATPVATPMIGGSPAFASRRPLDKVNITQPAKDAETAEAIKSYREATEEHNFFGPFEDFRGSVLEEELTRKRRVKSDAQAQQALPLPEGMTGAEVAAEELRVADQTPLASRRLRSNAEGQQVMNLEGMTGEEVAIEEARVAARKENRRVVTEGLKETRKLLRTPEEPLASRGRLNRAKEQGFDTDTVYYHGTGETFDEFDPLRGRTSRTDTGVYLSANPLVASTYTGERLPYDEPQVLPLYTRLKNPITVYADGNYWSQLGPDTKVDVPQKGTFTLKELMPSEEEVEASRLDEFGNVRPIPAMGGPLLWDTNEIARWARQQQGVDGVIFEDIIDRGVTTPRGADRRVHDRETLTPTRNLVVFDAQNIRSVNAEFDPARTESTNLLASRQRLPLTSQEQELSARAILESNRRYDESSSKLVTRQLADILDERVQSLFGRKLDERTDENKEIISNVMADEALSELDAEGNAVGWYKTTIEKMLSTFEQMYPEASKNPDNVDAFKFILAITSNGASVPENTRNALSVFDQYLASGSIPIRGFGKEVKAMEKAFSTFGQLENNLGSKRAVFDLLNQTGTVREIQQATGKKVSGENIDTSLPYSAIFGPKIGIFFQNLNGKWDFLTMDRWFMKTWGRYTGTNTPVFEQVFPGRAATLREEIKKQPRLKGYRKANLMRDDQELMRFAEENFRVYERGGFKDRSAINKKSKNLYEAVNSVKVAPTSGGERSWIREVTSEATRKLRDVGYDMDNATLQALLWYGEKKIYGNHGIINKKSEPTDYATEISRISESRGRPSGRPSDGDVGRSPDRVGSARGEVEPVSDTEVRQRERDSSKLKTKPEDSAALAEDKSKAATEVRGNPEADQAASEQLRTVKKLASRNKPSDIVEGTAYNRVADIGSRRASRGQGNINNAFSFEAPSGADDKGFVYQIQDKFIDLKKAIESIKKSRKKRGLTPLASIDDPYLGEESMHGIIGNKFNRFQKEVLEPLVDKLVARNISKKELEEFLVLRHAIERNAHVRKINAESKQPRPELEDGGAGSLNGQRLVDDYVKNEMQSKYGMQWNDSTQSWEGGNPRASVLNDLAADFDSITRGTLQELKDSGLMDQESLDKLQSYYKYYAPLRGVSPEDDVAIEEHARFSKSSNHLSIKGVETETTKGRVSEALPPLAQIVTQRQAAIRRGSINELIGQRMLTLIRENPNDSYWQIHNDRDSAGSTAELVGVKEDGKQLFVEFKDQRLRDAMLSLDAPQTNKALAVMRKINRFFSAVNTSYNPAFIFGNFFRDIGTAMGNLVGEQTMVGGKALNVKGLKRAVIFDTASSIRQVYRGLRGKKLSGKNAQDWKDYLESGAKTEWFHVQSPEESAASIDQLIEMAQGTFKGNYASGKQAIGNIVSDLNSAVENGVRFATFKKARDGFVRMGLPREEALAKAATLAKNLTVNFNRMGNQGEMLNAFYLFFNASVQGTANFVRGITTSRSKQAMLLSMVSFGAFVTRINELMGEDDEELGKSYYSEIEPWVKERNFILMKSIVNSDAPPNEYYTIPLPYGYNVLHVLGMDIMEVAMGIKSPEAATTQVAAASLGSFMPVGFGQSENPGTFIAKGLVPQIGKPIVEMLANEDFFGSPVYTENFQFGPKIPAALRSQRSTPAAFTETTKFLNAMTGGDESHAGALGWISPDVLDHLFGTILGGMGSFVERSGQSGAALTDWVEGDYVEGDISINDIPFLRRAMREVTGRESQSRYYDRREDIMADDRQMGLLRGTERREYRDENRSRLLMKRTLDATDKRLRNINRRLAVLGERILTSTSLEQTLRLEEMQSRLEDQKESAYKRFNKRFNERVGRTE